MCVIVLAGLAAGLAIGLSTSGSTPPLSHVAYARLWVRTTIGSPRAEVLSDWPKHPYQSYLDGFQNQCFEWWDKPLNLYNLCFRKGILITKSIT